MLEANVISRLIVFETKDQVRNAKTTTIFEGSLPGGGHLFQVNSLGGVKEDQSIEFIPPPPFTQTRMQTLIPGKDTNGT